MLLFYASGATLLSPMVFSLIVLAVLTAAGRTVLSNIVLLSFFDLLKQHVCVHAQQHTGIPTIKQKTKTPTPRKRALHSLSLSPSGHRLRPPPKKVERKGVRRLQVVLC